MLEVDFDSGDTCSMLPYSDPLVANLLIKLKPKTTKVQSLKSVNLHPLARTVRDEKDVELLAFCIAHSASGLSSITICITHVTK